MEIQKEYERIKGLFDGCDDKQLELLDGSFLECARLKVELDGLSNVIEQTGLIKFNPSNPVQQKELPVSKLIIKVRANYLNYISKLSAILGKNITEDEDELGDYE